MNILLTGAAGFIGSHVADKLLQKGAAVLAVDNFSPYYNPQFKENNVAPNLSNPNYQLFKTDITNFDELRTIFQKNRIDLIIHLAAQTGVRISIQKPLLAQKVNIESTYNIFELAREFKVRDVIFASSSSVYGNQQKIPFSETDNVDNPISPYAATKKACELIAYTYHHLYQMNCVGLRFFTAYGERGRPDMSPYIFMNAILHDQPIPRFGDGTMQRDFTYIDDIVDGVWRCVELCKTSLPVSATSKPFFEIINLGNAHPVSLNEYIATFEKVTGKNARIEERPRPAGDVDKTFADTSKARRLLGWQPTTTLEQGLTKFYHWFKQNRL